MAIKLLIVDDQALMRHALRRSFSACKIEVVAEAETAADALRLALEQPIDAVVLDLHLADGHSLDALAKIKLARPDLPVFMHSSDASPRWMDRARRSGADDYFIKGQENRRLTARIEALAGRQTDETAATPAPPRSKQEQPFPALL